MAKLKRIYHPYTKWEEYHNGMWRKVNEEEKIILLKKAIEFTGDYKLYGSFMKKVIKEWKYSCEHNLTDYSLNRQAWIGHAACCLAIGCPEEITREAWWNLTEEQQRLANIEADKAIKLWENKYKGNKDVQKILKL